MVDRRVLLSPAVVRPAGTLVVVVVVVVVAVAVAGAAAAAVAAEAAAAVVAGVQGTGVSGS